MPRFSSLVDFAPIHALAFRHCFGYTSTIIDSNYFDANGIGVVYGDGLLACDGAGLPQAAGERPALAHPDPAGSQRLQRAGVHAPAGAAAEPSLVSPA